MPPSSPPSSPLTSKEPDRHDIGTQGAQDAATSEARGEGDAQGASPPPNPQEEAGMQMAATPALRRGMPQIGPRSAQGGAARAASTTRLAALYREHHRMAFKAAWRVTGDAQDAEDVLQTVFLRLAREGLPAKLDNPAAYLNRAATNAALDVVRARKRRKVIPLEAPHAADGSERPRHAAEEVAATATDGAPDRDAAHGAAELRARLRTAVAALSPRMAEIFTLRYFEGWGNKEIAAHLDTTESSIGVSLFRARKQVREALAKAEEGGGR